jgi:hypothetical protein
MGSRRCARKNNHNGMIAVVHRETEATFSFGAHRDTGVGVMTRDFRGSLSEAQRAAQIFFS